MIKRMMGVTIVVVLMALQVFAQHKAKLYIEGGGKPLDFHDVYAGKKLTKDVTLKNIGTEPLHITQIKPQCGCTATGLKDSTIAPGDSTKLTVTFNSQNYNPGKYTKHVTISTNDTTTGGTQTLEFLATVTTALSLEPVFFSFQNAMVDSSYTKSLKISNTSKGPVNIQSVSTTADYLTLSLGKKHLEPGESTELTAVLHPVKAGSFQGTIQMATDNTDQKLIEIRYLAWINRNVVKDSTAAAKKMQDSIAAVQKGGKKPHKNGTTKKSAKVKKTGKDQGCVLQAGRERYV